LAPPLASLPFGLEKLGSRFGNVSHRISPQADASSRERLRRDPYYVPIEIEIDDDDRDEVRRIIEAINVTTDCGECRGPRRCQGLSARTRRTRRRRRASPQLKMKWPKVYFT